MAKKKDLDKANALVGMGDFQNMLNSISANNNAPKQSEPETKPVKEEETQEVQAVVESVERVEKVKPVENAEAPEAKADDKKAEEKKSKKKRYTLDEILTTKRATNGPNISLMVPSSVRDFLNLLKDMSPENASMVNILTNIVEDFKNTHRDEITERIRKMNEDKLNSF